jgi:hypothetical protein
MQQRRYIDIMFSFKICYTHVFTYSIAEFMQVKESLKLRQIMQTILTLGNALNQGTARGT